MNELYDVNKLCEVIKKADNSTLWAIVSDISKIINTPQKEKMAFIVWYAFYKVIEIEIDKRLLHDYLEEGV